jgi:hypothetical protein
MDHARDWDKLARNARKKLEDEAHHQHSPKSARLKRQPKSKAEDHNETDSQLES